MNNRVTLEVCVDTLESIDIASQYADRLELCSALVLEGLTPSASFVDYAKIHSHCSLQAMIRPRSGDFYYSPAEIELMIQDIKQMAAWGVDGIVFAALKQDNNIDISATKQLLDVAKRYQLETTFHRAIDVVDNFSGAIEQLIELEVTRILSSGHQQNVIAGKEKIRAAQQQYGQDIQIMAGGGVNANNVQALLQYTNIQHLHCSASHSINRYQPSSVGCQAFTPSVMTFKATDDKQLKLIHKKISGE